MSASCGIEPGRVVAYKPLLDKAIEPVVQESVVMSDVAWFAVDRVKQMVADERFSA